MIKNKDIDGILKDLVQMIHDYEELQAKYASLHFCYSVNLDRIKILEKELGKHGLPIVAKLPFEEDYDDEYKL